jgi:hypothetical protein
MYPLASIVTFIVFGIIMDYHNGFGPIPLEDLKLRMKAAEFPSAIKHQSWQEWRLIDRFADPKYTFGDLLEYAKELTKEPTAKEDAKTVLREYIVTLETMAQTKKDRDNEKNEIKKMIYLLREQQSFEFFDTDDPKSPAAKLLALGKEAIPYLIDELENGDFTRSVSSRVGTLRTGWHPRHVLRIGDCAYGILAETTGQRFGDDSYIHRPDAKMSPREVREAALQWWKKQK